MSRYLILGGIAGPVLFALTVSFVATLRPEYNHTTQFISELGESGGPNSSIMNYLGFKLPAMCIMLFAYGLYSKYSSNKMTKVAAILVGVFAVGMFLAGVYSCDPGCLVINPSTEQILHNLVSFVAFLALIMSTMLWGLYLRSIPGWSGFSTYSLITTGLSTLFLGLMIVTAATRNGAGLYQRLFLAALFIWMAAFAYRLWRNDPKSSNPIR